MNELSNFKATYTRFYTLIQLLLLLLRLLSKSERNLKKRERPTTIHYSHSQCHSVHHSNQFTTMLFEKKHKSSQVPFILLLGSRGVRISDIKLRRTGML